MMKPHFQNVLFALCLLAGTACSDAGSEGDEAAERSENTELPQLEPSCPVEDSDTPPANDPPPERDDDPVGTPIGGGRGSLPPVTSLSTKGPYNVTIDQAGGGNTWIFHPSELGRDGVKHPIFVWGTGATSVPRQYTDHFNLIASHGFVVISPNTGSVNARLMKAALDWIIAQDTARGSKFNGKLDTKKIAMGGHSLGSVSTFDAEATETRLTTTIHIAGGSFDGRGSSKVKTPTAYICGAAGDIAGPQCETDFRNMRAGGPPLFFSMLQGAGHIDAARKALPGMVGWLRWQLAGETQHKAKFSTGGEFFQGIWKSQVKNWN
jgi:hypothetical protein